MLAAAHPPHVVLTVMMMGGLLMVHGPAQAAIYESPRVLLCEACKHVVSPLGRLVVTNLSLDIVQDVAFAACDELHLVEKAGYHCGNKAACHAVCHGMIAELAPELLHILSQRELAATSICADLRLCPAQPRPSTIPSSPVAPSNLSDLTGEKSWRGFDVTEGVGTFVQLSDIHMDLEYTPGLSADCGWPLCCRPGSPAGNGSTSAGEWGHFSCDAAPWTVESLISSLPSALSQAPDFVTYTGDDPPHDVWAQSRRGNIMVGGLIADWLRSAFADVPVFRVLGNHDTFPVNQFEGPHGDEWMYESAASLWGWSLPDDAIRTLRATGMYAARAHRGLRVLVMNTGVYPDDGNFWQTLGWNKTDVAGQIPWLRDALQQCVERGERALILAHHVPHSWKDLAFSAAFDSIIERYNQTVIGLLFGHAHIGVAPFVFRGRDGQPVAIGHIGGSLTPNGGALGVNPGAVVYYYNRSTGEILDFEGWWADIDLANKQQRPPLWERHYSAVARYNLTRYSPSEVEKWGHRVASGAGGACAAYRVDYVRGGPQQHDNTGLACRALGCDILGSHAAFDFNCSGLLF